MYMVHFSITITQQYVFIINYAKLGGVYLAYISVTKATNPAKPTNLVFYLIDYFSLIFKVTELSGGWSVVPILIQYGIYF